MKRFTAFASAFIMIFAASSCGSKDSGGEFPDNRRDYIEYSIGSGYTFEEVGDKGDLRAYFTAGDGEKYEFIISRTGYESCGSKKRQEDEMLHAAVNLACKDIFGKGFLKIAEKHIGKVEYDRDKTRYDIGGASVFVSFLSPVCMFTEGSSGYEKGCKAVEEYITAGTGLCLKNETMKSLAANKRHVLTFSIEYEDAADEAKYTQMFDGVVSDYISAVGTPMNAMFLLKSDSENSKTVKSRVFVFGEEKNLEEEREKDKKFSVTKAVYKYYTED